MFILKLLRPLCICLLVLIFCAHASAGNTSLIVSSSSTDYLTIDPNDYDFLVYNCHGSEERIGAAMDILGLTYTECDYNNPITIEILAAHDILITTWNTGGNTYGLDPNVLDAEITGRIILTGHDSDYHTAGGTEESKRLLSQMINYVLTSSSDTGMIGLADASSIFSWLPSEWGITATSNSGENIEDFTLEGEDSGIYEGLTPEDMSDWGVSYHNTFTEFPSEFAAFELGGGGGNEIITIANVSPYNIDFYKYDDVSDGECVSPEEAIEYTICWENNGGETLYDVTIVDFLPIGVDYGSIMEDPNYNLFDRTYTWDIGTLVPDDSGCKTLDVVVNYNNAPGVGMRNVAHLKSGDRIISVANVVTPVCCWGGDIVYVNDTATGLNIGTSWANAYTDLKYALDRAGSCNKDVWIAGGTYSPGADYDDTFTIPDGVSVFGGLAGNEPSTYDPDDRDAIKYKSILTGYINDTVDISRVVTMGSGTKLHGFVVEDAYQYGVYGTGDDFTIERCIIQNSDDTGIYCNGGNLTVNWCTIKNNTNDGIYHSGSNKSLEVNNCDIFDNKENGIFTYGSTAIIKNSQVHHNGRSSTDYSGIRIEDPDAVPVIQNCTIMRNGGPGIDSGNESFDVYNCIFYKNDYHGDLEQFSSELTAHYSSVTDPADPNSTDCTLDSNNNMACDPNFAYIDINDHNLHLASGSHCVDMGVPSGEGFDPNYATIDYSDANDIDGDYRVYNSTVDIGSDEVACTDGIANDLDFNGDGLVNYREFAMFSKAWLQHDPAANSDPNYTANWNPKCNFDDTGDSQYVIDIDDLVKFAEDWAWAACWKHFDQGLVMMMAMGGGGESMMMAVPMQLTPFTTPAPEPTIEERIEQTENGLEFLNEVLKDEEVKETIDLDNLQKVIDSLEDQLEELTDQL